MAGFSSPTRFESKFLAVRAQSPNHWATREFLAVALFLGPTNHLGLTRLFYFAALFLNNTVLLSEDSCTHFLKAQRFVFTAAAPNNVGSRAPAGQPFSPDVQKNGLDTKI